MIKEKKAVLIAFSVQSSKFENSSERNKFFRMLYGWKQTIPNEKNEKKDYVYQREGLLDEMPHVRVDQSSFIVPENNFDKIFEFFDEWSNKVIWKAFKVLMDKNLENIFEEFEEDEEESEEEI
jgi:hypothetical protein